MAQVLITQQEARVRCQNADFNILELFRQSSRFDDFKSVVGCVRSLIKTHQCITRHVLFAIDK